MLYLIKSAGYDESGNYIDLLKVGYAEDVSFRMVSYKMHNPTCKLLSVIEGSMLDEARVQYHFRQYRFTGYGKEWFVYNDEIVNFFESDPDLSNLDDFDGLRKVRKLLSGFIEKMVQRYFLSEVFSVDRRNFYELDKIEEKARPIYDLIGRTVGTEDDVINELSKVLGVDVKILKSFRKLSSGVKEVDQAFKKFRKATKFPEKMQIVCTSDLSDENRRLLLQRVPVEFSKYYYLLGSDQCKAVSYRKSLLEGKLNVIIPKKSPGMVDVIYREFLPGRSYTKSSIKNRLGEIYKEYEYNKTAKASDLEEYFELKDCLVSNKETGKRDHGFEIVRVWDSVEESIIDAIYSVFEIGKRYTKADIKETLRSIYVRHSLSQTPKASQLLDYFELRPCQITNQETGKIDNGFEIIKKR